MHDLGRSLLGAGGSLRGHILLTHTHWDHIQGIPFFSPLFIPGNEFDVYAPRGLSGSIDRTLSGQMQYTYFPVSLQDMGASVRFHELIEGAFQAGEVRVRAQYLNHPALTLGYRLEVDGCTLVYASDHEPFSRDLAAGRGQVRGEDRRHLEFVEGADLLIHDSQYTASEYEQKHGWGHSTVEYVVGLARSAGVKQLALFHHDPQRDDDSLDALAGQFSKRVAASGRPSRLFAAAEGQTVELVSTTGGRRTASAPDSEEATRVVGALAEAPVLLATADDKLVELVQEALREDGPGLVVRRDPGEAVRCTTRTRLSTIVLDHELPGVGSPELTRQLRQHDSQQSEAAPVVIIANSSHRGLPEGVSEVLVQPLTAAYLRARLVAWVLRRASRWQAAERTPEEGTRLRGLHDLRILDTAPEERFDRITRLAADVLGVPIGLVSLVDHSRQWFKSCVGLDVSETSRESSFCAHAILQPDILVVSDALEDDRFAENPYVMGGPHIRFYAGCPLRLANGLAAGTLCLMDTRPRDPDERALGHIRYLASLVERELQAVAPESEHP